MTNECAKEMFNNIRRYNKELINNIDFSDRNFDKCDRFKNYFTNTIKNIDKYEIHIVTKDKHYTVNFDDIILYDNYLTIKSDKNGIYSDNFCLDRNSFPYDLSDQKIFDVKMGHVYLYRQCENVPYEEIVRIEDGIAANVFKYDVAWSGLVERDNRVKETIELYN